MKKLLFSVVLLGLLSACASTNSKTPAPVDNADGGKTNGSEVTTSGTGKDNVVVDVLHDPRSVLSKRSIYYDFDSYAVKDEYKPLVEAHARYLKAHGDNKVFLRGNCDERGSREYNIALGQKRAEGVKKMMSVLGVPDSQIETVSYGEEKPRAEGHDEAAWEQNRRTDIVYKGE